MKIYIFHFIVVVNVVVILNGRRFFSLLCLSNSELCFSSIFRQFYKWFRKIGTLALLERSNDFVFFSLLNNLCALLHTLYVEEFSEIHPQFYQRLKNPHIAPFWQHSLVRSLWFIICALDTVLFQCRTYKCRNVDETFYTLISLELHENLNDSIFLITF